MKIVIFLYIFAFCIILKDGFLLNKKEKKKTEVKKALIEDISLEIVRFEEGLKASTDQLSKLYKKALESVSENESSI